VPLDHGDRRRWVLDLGEWPNLESRVSSLLAAQLEHRLEHGLQVAGDGGRLERWPAGAALPVRVVDGEPGVRAIAVSGRELRTR
jgi:hypothetical protein